MATGKRIDNLEKDIRCPRCRSKMIFEKFYGESNTFFGWHCVICGEILDPVILLHRLSRDAGLQIPEEEKEVMQMLKKYLQAETKEPRRKKQGRDLGFGRSANNESRLNELGK